MGRVKTREILLSSSGEATWHSSCWLILCVNKNGEVNMRRAAAFFLASSLLALAAVVSDQSIGIQADIVKSFLVFFLMAGGVLFLSSFTVDSRTHGKTG